jgi:hypothetical protein
VKLPPLKKKRHFLKILLVAPGKTCILAVAVNALCAIGTKTKAKFLSPTYRRGLVGLFRNLPLGGRSTSRPPFLRANPEKALSSLQ